MTYKVVHKWLPVFSGHQHIVEHIDTECFIIFYAVSHQQTAQDCSTWSSAIIAVQYYTGFCKLLLLVVQVALQVVQQLQQIFSGGNCFVLRPSKYLEVRHDFVFVLKYKCCFEIQTTSTLR